MQKTAGEARFHGDGVSTAQRFFAKTLAREYTFAGTAGRRSRHSRARWFRGCRPIGQGSDSGWGENRRD